MKNILPIIEIDEFDRLWLQEVYDIVRTNKMPEQRKIWSKLYGRLPRSFNTISIDPRLCNASGEYITILGIIALERNHGVIQILDTLFLKMKEIILADPTISEIDITNVAKKGAIDPIYAGIILKIAMEYGNFYKSASITPGGFGFTSIDIGTTDNLYQQYLHFEGIEEVIDQYLKRKEINEKRSQLLSNAAATPQKQIFPYAIVFQSKISNVNLGLCFVLMPFTEEWSDRVYTRLIKPNIEAIGMQCMRADNLNGPIIIEDIWIQINNAAIIIADVTNKNANVMYELGIVHTLAKPSILITQDIANKPFDLAHLRQYEYKDNIDSFENAGKKIREVIKELRQQYYPNSQSLKAQ